MMSGSARPAIHRATLATTESTSAPHCEDALLPFSNSANCCLNAVTKTPIGAATGASDLIQVIATAPAGSDDRVAISDVEHLPQHEGLKFEEGHDNQQHQDGRAHVSANANGIPAAFRGLQTTA